MSSLWDPGDDNTRGVWDDGSVDERWTASCLEAHGHRCSYRLLVGAAVLRVALAPVEERPQHRA